MTKTYIALIAPKAVRNAEICSIADPLIANEDDWLPCNGMLFIGIMDVNNFDPTDETNAIVKMKKHACGLYLTPFDTAAPIVATVNRIQDTNELLAPINVPAVMEFDMPDGTRLQKHCAVNFQTGDIYGVIAPADASDACVIIPFTDKILPCRPGPTPSLKQ